MKKTTSTILALILGLSVLFAGCSNAENNQNEQDINNSTTIVEDDNNQTNQQDPINESIEEDTVDENDDVEIGELI